MNQTATWISGCVAAVLIVAAIVGGIVYGVHQGTERQANCIKGGGSWIDGRCIVLRPGDQALVTQ